MSRASFAPIDLLLLAAYAALTLVIGFWRRRRTHGDFLVAGRQLGLPVFVATVVATWYGGILGVGEMTYRYGLINWTTQGLPYYIMAVVFALTLAGRVRAASLYTIPDKLEEVHGRGAALVGGVFAFIMTTPAPYVLMVGQLVRVVTGWPLPAAIVAGVIFSVAYVYVGGFQSDVRINVFQFVLMFAGFMVALPVVATRTGGLVWLGANLPSEHLRLDGGLGPCYIAVWFFIAIWTIVDPGFHQRCYAARSPRVARNGILVAVGCWIVFDLLTTLTGLYARATMPDLGASQAGLAFPLLAERLLPPGVKALFYIAMLATVMSTVVSYTFLGGMTIGRDLVWRIVGGPIERVTALTRVGLVITSVAAIGIALAVPSVVQQWWAIGTVCVPAMLPAVVTSYAPRWRNGPMWTIATMVAGGGASALCLAYAWVRHGMGAEMSDSTLFPFGLQPMYPGLACAALTHLAGRAAQHVAPAVRR
ncbi:MAG: sodium:solute symporter family protein [Armatimonadetes bacterium]|nr:sodium:solute symporter family protein [Armatimonadota bacterium]